jgi:hypothetical protein
MAEKSARAFEVLRALEERWIARKEWRLPFAKAPERK